MADKIIQWHPGFAAAIDLELSAYRQDLIYEREYNLNTKPLEIDLLVIKKNEKVQIDNEIGAQFLGHNILEYKSPDDSLDIDTFYKTSAYASLYKAYGKTVDEIKASDITVSIIRNRKPYGLFRYFTENEYRVTNPYPGIYYIKSGVLFPTQIIVTRELDTKHHTWLKSLSDKLEKHEIKQLLEKIEGLSESFDKRLADSILEVAIRANKETVEELIGDESMCQALMEIMEPEINQIINEQTQKILDEKKQMQKLLEEQEQKLLEEQKQKQQLLEEREQSILQMVVTLREFGAANSKIKECLINNYKLSEEEAEGYIESVPKHKS